MSMINNKSFKRLKTSCIAIILMAAMIFAMIPVVSGYSDGSVYAADNVEVKTTKTKIKCENGAAAVGEGYGLIYSDDDAQIALVNSKGKFIHKYTKKYAGTGYEYRVSGKRVSLITALRTEIEGMKPHYYKLNGTKLTEIKTKLVLGSAMNDGYATGYIRSGDKVKPVIINKNGKIIYRFPDKYDLGVSGSDVWENKYGKLVAATYYEDGKYWAGICSEGLVPVGKISKKNGEYFIKSVSVFNVKGKKLFTIKNVDDYTSYNEGMMIISKNGKYGFVNKKGKVKVKCKYDDAYKFENGYAPVCRNGKWGYINKKGKVVIPLKYEAVYGAGNGIAVVVKDGKCGAVDFSNNVVIPLEYYDMSGITNGTAYASKNNKLYILKVK